MKIKNNKPDGLQIGDFNSIESTIRNEDLGLALGMVSKNLYSNPIGSFIRELVSNAWDANVEAEETSPVLVHTYREDDFMYIEVKDNGVGMSPETFKEVYMSWFNSDKRDTNTKIGGWGLGSKSPLAYQDSFEIITKYNGIKYHYILANELPVPTATLLLDEPTEEGNGTTIKVEIKEGDDFKIHQECINQLVYFDNVYVKDELWYYDNTFKIYDSEHFKLRNKNFPYQQEMHIVLGQVAYPIDWNVLGIDIIHMPVALKFNVGDLEVTLSREEINYTDKVKEKLLNKIELVAQDLYNRYQKQCKINDLFEYVKLIKDSGKPDLIIEDVSISMKEAKPTITFSPLPGITIKGKNVTDIFLKYSITSIIDGKHYTIFNYDEYYWYLYRYTSNCYLCKTDINYFDSKYIYNGYIFRKRKINRKDYRKLAILLGLTTPVKRMRKGTNTLRFEDTVLISLGAYKKIYKLLKYVDDYLDNIITPYEGSAPDYWIEEQKSQTREKRERTKGEITYYNTKNNRRTIMLSDLITDNKIVFYINKDEKKELILGYHAIYELGNTRFKQQTAFVIVSATVINKLRRNKNTFHIKNIFKIGSYSNLLHRLRISKIVCEKIKGHSSCFNFSSYYSTMYRNLVYTYTIKYKFNYYSIPVKGGKEDFFIDIYDLFKENIDSLKLTKHRTHLMYEDTIPEMLKAIEQYSIFTYLKNTVPMDMVLKLCKILKLKHIDASVYNYNFINN